MINLKKAAGAFVTGAAVVGAEHLSKPPSLGAESAGLAGLAVVGFTASGDFSEGAALAALSLLAKNGVRFASKSGGASARGHSHNDGNELCELCILKEREALGV